MPVESIPADKALTTESSFQSAHHNNSMVLTPEGREEIITGRKTCSNRDVQFLGDQWMRPITSMENALLVRFFHLLSKYINKKTGMTINLRPLASYNFYLLVLLFLGLIVMLWILSKFFLSLSQLGVPKGYRRGHKYHS